MEKSAYPIAKVLCHYYGSLATSSIAKPGVPSATVPFEFPDLATTTPGEPLSEEVYYEDQALLLQSPHYGMNEILSI